MRFNGICLVSSNIRQLRAFYIELLQVQPSGDEDWWVDFGVVGDTSLAAQQTPGLLGERQVQGHEVRPGQKLIEADDVDAELLGFGRGPAQVAAGGDHLHAEGSGATRDGMGGGTPADEAEGAARQPVQGEGFGAGLAEGAGAHVPRHARDLAREGQDHGHHVVGHLGGAEVGYVGDDDATLGGAGDVDLVGAVAEPGDQPALVEAVDDGCRQRGRDHADGVGVAYVGDDVLRARHFDFDGPHTVAAQEPALRVGYREHLGVEAHDAGLVRSFLHRPTMLVGHFLREGADFR